MNKKKLLQKLLSSSKNIKFGEVTIVAEAVGFRLDRVKGSHHIFIHEQIPEIVNLQKVKGEAKPYQVRQLVKMIEKYNLQIEE